MFHFQPDEERQPVIVTAFRSPIGRAFGTLAAVNVENLLKPIIEYILDEIALPPDRIDDVLIGNAAGGGGNIARLAGLAAGLPVTVAGVTIDRQCGSGLEAIILAARLIQANAGDCYLAGGVESISTAPWRVEKPTSKGELPRFYGRARFSPDKVGDPEMGVAAENVARECGITRERQDAFALRSHCLAVDGAATGTFRPEIVPIETNKGFVSLDECPRTTTSMEALAKLPPAFVENGTVTAGNACPLNDGASLVLITSRGLARRLGCSEGLAFIDGAAAGVDPNLLGLGPVASTKKLLFRQPRFQLSDVTAFEFNEAFAAQVLGSLDQLSIPSESVNKNGGAIALGHPFGASGAILVTRLFSQLVRQSRNDENIGATAMAMVGIGGGLGLTALFQKVRTS